MKRILIVIAAMSALLTAVSCDKYEDGRPSKEIRQLFAEMYPDAKDVEWEAEKGYWKVSFETGTAPAIMESEAWYDAAGNWVRTETDILPSSVPEEIKTILGSSEYGSAMIDEVEYVQTPDEEFYQFSLSLAGLPVYINVYKDGRVALAKFEW